MKEKREGGSYNYRRGAAKRCTLGSGPEARRLATHVFAKKNAPAELAVGEVADEFYPLPPDKSSELKLKKGGNA